MSRDGRRRAWREFSYYPEHQAEEGEGLYSGLEISEYSDYGNNSANANSDYASPVTEELLLSPLSQRSLEQCEELELDPGWKMSVGQKLSFTKKGVFMRTKQIQSSMKTNNDQVV